MIPSKKSKKWIGVFIFYTIVVFISLISTRFILGSEIVGDYIFGMVTISLGSALIPCIGGFWGRQMFFKVYTFSAAVGILYMFYVVLGNTAPGWGDLTSIVGYLFMVGVGAIVGLVTELAIYFIKTKKN